ncbi:hypothetical protein F4824DRAFT_499175 [Ustulina deusta]|nr:hypothetical protein F4824DRAFT_499175 [Ustulina deusta]
MSGFHIHGIKRAHNVRDGQGESSRSRLPPPGTLDLLRQFMESPGREQFMSDNTPRLIHDYKTRYPMTERLDRFVTRLAHAAFRLYKKRLDVLDLLECQFELGETEMYGVPSLTFGITCFRDDVDMEIDYMFLMSLLLRTYQTVDIVSDEWQITDSKTYINKTVRRMAEMIFRDAYVGAEYQSLASKIYLLIQEEPPFMEEAGKMKVNPRVGWSRFGTIALRDYDERCCDLLPDVRMCLRACGTPTIPLREWFWIYITHSWMRQNQS